MGRVRFHIRGLLALIRTTLKNCSKSCPIFEKNRFEVFEILIKRNKKFLNYRNFFYVIDYIFYCGLHYLAMLKLFQRIIFACLTKELFHVEAISYIAMVKVFFNFSCLNPAFISSILKLAIQ